jgi:hypothetical protein
MSVLSLREWASGIELAIKMVDYCQNAAIKRNIISAS